MRDNRLALLGVSFDNVSLEEAASQLISYINSRGNGSGSRYVCTVNVDFLAKAYGLDWSEPYDPELVDLYRKSEFVTCDGAPLLWLSRLLGSPIKERVTGTDLIPRLITLLAKNHKTLFLLGGSENINKVAGVVLEAMHPELRIVGRASPAVATEGEGLLSIAEQDEWLVKEINRTAPDVLLIAFGNPKQEKWFDRVRQSLNVPVSIGVGGAFDIIAGAHARAPVWMQRGGLEWLYRLLQEPKRLWKRYFIDSWMFLWLSIPLVVVHSASRLLYRLLWEKKERAMEYPLLFLSPTQTIAMIPLPPLIDQEFCDLADTHLDESFNQDTVILDFDGVRHITLEGFALLVKIWQKAEKNGRELYAMNVSGDIKLLMKVHRIWDLVKNSVMNNPEQVLRALIQGNSHPNYFESVQQSRDMAAIYFFGKISADQNKDEYVERLAPLLRDKDCVLDFRYCTHIDHAGFSFLLKLQKIVEMHHHALYIRKRSSSVERFFRLNGVDHLFKAAR